MIEKVKKLFLCTIIRILQKYLRKDIVEKIQIKDVFSKEKKVIILLYKVGFKIKILFFNVSKIFSVTHKSLVKKCFNNIFFN